ncbi:hypothetical protein AABD41_01475 [Staphylococcus pseudoxylosus]|uniref:hypothetical protein n=1 Tax=Staphylococcus pseudoxylosus TaxID=2282419 RepID=UPI00398A97A4
MKYKMENSNTDVRKLWNLARNGVLSYQTVHKIFENDCVGVITFNSKRTYDKFKQYEFSTSAMY